VVRIFGEEYRREAQVEVLNGFSGHADRAELLAWYGAMDRKPAQTYLVHGEIESAMALKESLEQTHGATVTVPEQGQRFEI
jgi:metallo-beta-lactamase family protein